MFGLFKSKPKIEIAFNDADVLLNADLIKKMTPLRLNIAARHTNLQIGALDVGMILVLARMQGWSGASALFRRTRTDLWLLVFQGAHVIPDNEARSLSALLLRYVDGHPEPDNPTVIAAAQLATLCATSGFTMTFV